MSKKEVEYLRCIICNREHEHKEIFVAYMAEDKKDKDYLNVIITHCVDRCPWPGDASKPEKEGTGWVTLQRIYDHYEIIEED